MLTACSSYSRSRALVWTVAMAAVVDCRPAAAQQLPVTRFSGELVQSQVTGLLVDSPGFLWISTYEGLTRFDGYEFRNYVAVDGFNHPIVNDVVEGPDGSLWIATNGAGVARLVDDPGSAPASPEAGVKPRKFVSFLLTPGSSVSANAVNGLAFDEAGHLWCATDNGAYRSEHPIDADPPSFVEVAGTRGLGFRAVQRTSRGMFLLGNQRGRLTSGRLLVATSPDRATLVDTWDDSRADAMAISDGQLVVGRGRKLVRYYLSEDDAAGGEAQIPLPPDKWITTLLGAPDGSLWVGTTSGLYRWSSREIQKIGAKQDLGRVEVTALSLEGDGTLWIGTARVGLLRLSSTSVLTWTTAQGLPDAEVTEVLEGSDGRIYATTASAGLIQIDGSGEVRQIAGSASPRFRGASSLHLQPGRNGDWWLVTREGVYALSGPTPQFNRPRRFYPREEFSQSPLYLAGPDAPVPFIDSRGRVWVASVNGLFWLDPEEGDRARFTRLATFPAGAPQTRVISETKSGDFWLAGNVALGKLVRGHPTFLKPTQGLPEVMPRGFLIDRRGWLWVGLRHQGVSVAADPASPSPVFQNFSTETGLSSNVIWSIAEDSRGRIYLGTQRGVDRLDPETGRVRRFSVRDGLAGDQVRDCFRDSRGYIWVATAEGLSRIDPDAPEVPSRSPRIHLTRLQVAGEEVPLPERGAVRMDSLALPTSRNSLVIEYVGLNLPGTPLTYQYRLEGVDQDWSAPTRQRAVTYARLSSGQYQFKVRAITWDGVISSEPAELGFRIDPPFWRRTWFLPLVLVLAGAGGFALHRTRLRQALALERIRRQIATDLHDDVGAGLSQVAILSEVARRTAEDRERQHALGRVGDLARSMRVAMSDIVWSIDPRNDRLLELVIRVCEAAENTLESRGISVKHHLPPPAVMEGLELTPDRRRQLLLFCKEAVNNIAKHADASEVEIAIDLEPRALRLSIRDNGAGFDKSAIRLGQGLTSLTQRITALGGVLHVESSPGNGTTLEASVPL